MEAWRAYLRAPATGNSQGLGWPAPTPRRQIAWASPLCKGREWSEDLDLHGLPFAAGDRVDEGGEEPGESIDRYWLWVIVPWLPAAIGAGVVYGLLGRWWGRSRSIVAGVAIALPFFVEQVWWRVYDGFLKRPLIVWIVEVAVGITFLGWVFVARRPLTRP